MTVINLCSDQSSARGFDDLDSLLCVQWRLQSKTRWNQAEIFAVVVEPELLSYSSDVACVTDVYVGKSFALSFK